MKRVGRWTWMLLTLLLLLCTTAFAKTIECGSIELEQPVEVTFDAYNTPQYTLTAPIDATRVKVEWLNENKNDAWLTINKKSASSTDGIFTLNKENTVKVYPASSNLIPLTVRFVLHEYRNDEQEPNDVIPTELHDGDSVKFVLDSDDTDRFTITTEKPGQDIALTFSGFNYADRTSFYLNWDRKQEIKKNGTVFLHAGEPGAYQFYLSKSGSGEISRSMEIHLLDGDENELNDTKETATPLPIGTDAAFSIGGINDEDWFSFEAVPEEGKSKIYTLRLLDFDPENSETVSYKIYAPDGSVVAGNSTSSRHTRVFSCSQQGQYAVRLYPKEKYDYYSKKFNFSIQRAALRIRVEEGGDDPYESNDTWLDAAYIEPGQLISHVLNSGDTDWYCFTVPEDHMTLHVSSDCAGVSAGVYTGRDLAEYGESAKKIWSGIDKSANNLYWKLDEKGLYYIRLSGGSSEKICSTMISLLPPDEIEDNDVWYRATPLYEEFTQAFDVSGPNDMDWFRFTVPEGSQKTLLLDIAKRDTGNKYERVSFYLYREAYFDNQDDGSLKEGAIETGPDPESRLYYWDIEPGTYYLLAKSNNSSNYFTRVQKLNICYKLVSHLNNNTIATASPLKEREWQDVWQKGYFSIGEHKAGEVVQIQHDEGGSKPDGSIDVYDADGKRITYSFDANFSFRIPADGVYYLEVPASIKFSENELTRTTRIRYYTHNDEIGAADTITVRPNESVFLDLWFSPEIRNSLKVESEDEALTYDLETGYLTAPNTPEGSADLVFSNGYPEGDEKRVEAVTHVIWSENPLSDISISNAPQSLPVGSSVQLEAAVSPEDYICHISWKSSDTSVLRVLSNGKIIAVGQGEAVITASIGEATSSVTITVTGGQPGESGLTGVSLDRYTLTLYAGEEAEQLTATLKPEGTEATIRWTSSNQTAATVSQDGKVTPLAAGVTVVTAAAGDYRASCIVTVQPERVRVTGIRFDEPTHTLMMGSTVTLQPIIAPDDATVKNLTWVSSDEQTATVSRTGIVTALSVGETTITATTVDGGYSAEIKIIVTAAAQLGDVNGDGYIDAADALLCLRASVGLITLTPEQEAAADVNHDGLIDAGDAILILRYDARLIPSLN